MFVSAIGHPSGLRLPCTVSSPASFSLLAVDSGSTWTDHKVSSFPRARWSMPPSTRNFACPRRFASNRSFHRAARFGRVAGSVVRGTLPARILRSGRYRCVRSRPSRPPRTPRVPRTTLPATRPGTMVELAAQHHRRIAGERARRSLKCDEAVRVAPYGFGQHENPICARPRRLAPAITASNFVGASFIRCSTCIAQRPILHRELLVARPSSLPSTCSHHIRCISTTQ